MPAEKHETRREFGGALLLVVFFAIVCAVLVGLWIGFWAALAVTLGFALVGIAAAVRFATRGAHPPAADAPHVRPVDDGRRRLLIVADERFATPGFLEDLRSRAGQRPVSIFVMAPALQSKLGRLAGDEKGYADATRRLNETLAALDQAGLQADGEIGSSDPLQAVDDGLRQFPADEIVFVTHPEGTANWLEQGVVELAESRYDQPVRHVTVEAV